MTIAELIETIKQFDSTQAKAPGRLKVIIGQDGFHGFCDDNKYALTSPIDIYKEFREVAFIDEKLEFAASEIFVIGLFFGDLNIAAEFIGQMKKEKIHYSKFVEYLYYSFGIVLVNRKAKATKFKIFDSKIVDDVLNVGGFLCQSVKSHLDKNNNDIRMGQCIHCSPKVMNSDRYFRLWFLNDDSAIGQIGLYNKTSFGNFKIFTID